MFTGDEDVEATALRAQGWSISAIARHLDRDRKTVRGYLNGERVPGERRRAEPDPLERFVPYLRQRLADDPHVWASALFDEVQLLGFALSYPTFTRGLRARGLRPHCEACARVKGRATIEIEHPPGEEIQWDWVELGEAPWRDDAHLLVGSLPCSGRFRGVFAESEDQPHLIEGIDEVLRRLGGTARRWRVDRMATVVDPGSGRLQRSFAPVAKHYAVSVVPCPPRRGNRKGSVEKSIHYATGRFWRTMTATTIVDAQAQFDRFCRRIGDRRLRPIARLEALLGAEAATALLAQRGRRRPTVADLAELEPLAPLPAAVYPASIEQSAKVGPSALVAFEGNAYSVPPGLVGAQVSVRHRLGAAGIEVVSPGGGVLLASHRRERPGIGVVVRAPEHDRALQAEVLAAFSTTPPCRRKANRPPSPAARAEAARLLGTTTAGDDVVVDLAAYQALVDAMGRRDDEVGA
ncbi:MAG: IS21 family transposase [Acidimicrobiales bacterium]